MEAHQSRGEGSPFSKSKESVAYRLFSLRPWYHLGQAVPA